MFDNWTKRILLTFALIFAFVAGGYGLANALTTQATQTTNYCVEFGSGSSAKGNVVLFNWDHSQCPAGTYGHAIQATSGTTGTDTDNYLPQDGFAFFAGSLTNTNFPPTVFSITDDTTAGLPGGTVTTYHCHFTSPTETAPGSGIFTPGIQCTK